MIQTNRRLKWKRSAGEVDDAGFTLIELLIVIVVLGILAAIVVFALSGVTSQSTVAACNSDAKTVDTAVAAYQANLSLTPSTQVTQAEVSITSDPTNGTLQSWPNNTANHYAIVIAGDGNSQVGQTAADTVTPAITIGKNDTLVQYGTGTSATYYDATQDPTGACANA